MKIEIKGSDGFVSIEVVGYENTSASTPEDANWLLCYVEVKAGVFSGEYQASFTTEDFVDFQQQLASAVESLDGTACFETIENALRISVEIRSSGEVMINGVARSVGASRTNLTFAISSDQSCLSQTISQLQSVIQTFPVKTV